MNVSLVFPPLYGVDMPPLGIAYIAAQLLRDGHRTNMHCLNSRLYQQNKEKRFLWDWDSSSEWENEARIARHFNIPALLDHWSKTILKDDPDVIGFSVNSHSRVLANLLANRLKQKNNRLFLIFGGPWCAEILNETDLNNNVDFYVRGEGEKIVSIIIRKIAGSRPLKECSIKGTLVNTGRGFKDNGWDNQCLNIDEIPFPALGLFDLDNYTNKTEIPILFSRGCNYNCKFCTDKSIWGRYRMRSAGNILEEIRSHSRIFGRKRFKSNDLMVNGDLYRLEKFADESARRKVDFEWGGMARANPKMTQELFCKLRKAGCIYFTYGVESGARRVLRHMGKPSKHEIARALKMTHFSGIKVNTLWMAGYPVETWSDFLETLLFLSFNRKNIDEFVSVSTCYLPRRSYIWEHRKELNIKHNVDSQWYIGNTNTQSIRNLRRKILLCLAKMLGIYRGGIS